MTLERWATFPKRVQLLHIGAEFERARVWDERGDREEVQKALARADELIALSIRDAKWENEVAQIEALKTMVEEFIRGARKENVAVLYHVL